MSQNSLKKRHQTQMKRLMSLEQVREPEGAQAPAAALPFRALQRGQEDEVENDLKAADAETHGLVETRVAESDTVLHCVAME